MNSSKPIELNAAKLQELKDAIQAAFRVRNESASKMEAWQEACRRFHLAYDELAFPGGLAKAMLQLQAADPMTIELAVQFLEADPWFFRSGYIKEEVLERIRWVPLDLDQKRRLQQLILARVRDPRARREFRRYCRLAPFITDPEFEKEIVRVAGPSGTKPKRAQWVLEHLRQGKPKRKKL